MSDPQPARILLAVGLDGKGVVLSTDSAWVASEVDAVTALTDDLGIAHPAEPGLYLWAGTLATDHTPDTWVGPGEDYTRFAGEATRVAAAQYDGLLAMAPPPPADVPERACRACGCTDDDCRQCVEKTGGPCSWVEADLCSACEGTAPGA